MESKKEKFRRSLLDLADSGKYIPGIYNYCDRWCERCSLSCKCLTHAHELEMKEESNDPESNCLDKEKFWEQIRLSFEVTLDMISEDAKRLGIDLNKLPDVEEPEHLESPAEKLAGEYGTAMGNWLEENCERLHVRGKQLLTIRDKKDPALKFADAVEVVQWYCYFISSKIHRAYYELDSRLKEDEDDFDLISDNIGSAKVALIAISRSIEALTVLYPQMKNHEDEILQFLGQLTKIKNMMTATFPTALEFKRPGFDD